VWAVGACEVDSCAALSHIRHAPFRVCNLIFKDIGMLSEKKLLSLGTKRKKNMQINKLLTEQKQKKGGIFEKWANFVRLLVSSEGVVNGLQATKLSDRDSIAGRGNYVIQGFPICSWVHPDSCEVSKLLLRTATPHTSALGSVVGWCTVLWIGRSRVPFPVRSLDVSIG
jgi:hypothetical protein